MAEPVELDVANLTAEQTKIVNIARAWSGEIENYPLNVMRSTLEGTTTIFFLIFEQSAIFHTWIEVIASNDEGLDVYKLRLIPHMG